MQTKKVTSFPVVLLGHAYWDGLVDWLRSTVLAGGKINERDLTLFHVTDDPAEAVRLVTLADEALGVAPVPDGEAARKGAGVAVAAVCVFCSSSGRIDPSYVELAAAVGTELARRGHSLVSGGGSVSCMGAVARAARAGGAQTVGVIPRVLLDMEVADHDADELLVTDDMRARKGLMDARSDAFLTLPGGLGTLEELLEIWVSRTLAHARQAGRGARPGRPLRPAARAGRPARRARLRPRRRPRRDHLGHDGRRGLRHHRGPAGGRPPRRSPPPPTRSSKPSPDRSTHCHPWRSTT